jgi:hypothetical protein
MTLQTSIDRLTAMFTAALLNAIRETVSNTSLIGLAAMTEPRRPGRPPRWKTEALRTFEKTTAVAAAPKIKRAPKAKPVKTETVEAFTPPPAPKAKPVPIVGIVKGSLVITEKDGRFSMKLNGKQYGASRRRDLVRQARRIGVALV